MGDQEWFFIVAKAEDPEGVKQVEVFGEALVSCTNNEGLSQSIFINLRAIDIDESLPGETGQTRRWIPFNVNPSSFANCTGNGFQPLRVKISLRAKGTNFHGLSNTTALAIFTYHI